MKANTRAARLAPTLWDVVRRSGSRVAEVELRGLARVADAARRHASWLETISEPLVPSDEAITRAVSCLPRSRR